MPQKKNKAKQNKTKKEQRTKRKTQKKRNPIRLAVHTSYKRLTYRGFLA